MSTPRARSLPGSRMAGPSRGLRFCVCLYLLVSIACAMGPAAGAAVTFSGEASEDFPPANFVPDSQDVGVPPSPEFEGVISGWDLRGLYFDYDPASDTASFGLDFFGVAGDADGREGPNTSSAALVERGGRDLPDLAQTESITILFDVDRDGTFDFVAGVPGGHPLQGAELDCPVLDLNDCFGLFDVVDDDSHPEGRRFAAKRQEAITLSGFPSERHPDFEFAIPNWLSLLAESDVFPERCGAWSIDVRVFAGSFEDDGVGEDTLPNGEPVVTLDFPVPASELCTCEKDLNGTVGQLLACEEQLAGLIPLEDSDGDGIPDMIDQCPQTGASTATDLLGCSHAAFCAKFEGRGWRARLRCSAADWHNDEPLSARDCRMRRGRCVPR